jgi:uncharacterized protein YigA (DUF484 family)
MDMAKNVATPTGELDYATVSAWLDSHPEFLSDYLKKLQIQRRRSSIMNESVLAEFNATHLNFKSSNSSSRQTLSTTLEENNRSKNASPIPSPSVTPAVGFHTQSSLNSKLTKLSTSNINSMISMPFLMPVSTTSTNLSYSEPSIPPSILFDSFNEDSENEDKSVASASATLSSVPTYYQNNHHHHHHQQQQQLHNSHQTVKQKFYRTKFKNLSLYEKMYTLVKTLYQTLDLKQTCKEILNTVSLLLDADRCSLFLVTDEDVRKEESSSGNSGRGVETNGPSTAAFQHEKCLISVVFDAKSKNKRLSPSSDNETAAAANADDDFNEQIKIPYGRGIAGYVASTGLALNIQDAYADSRFIDTIDKQTGYKTKNILCLPILNENGECIAVAEAINKLSDESNGSLGKSDSSSQVCFTIEDEQVFNCIGSKQIVKNVMI